MNTVTIDEDELKDLKEDNSRLRQRLDQLADEQAELGRIHNTPQAKRDWIYRDTSY